MNNPASALSIRFSSSASRRRLYYAEHLAPSLFATKRRLPSTAPTPLHVPRFATCNFFSHRRASTRRRRPMGTTVFSLALSLSPSPSPSPCRYPSPPPCPQEYVRPRRARLTSWLNSSSSSSNSSSSSGAILLSSLSSSAVDHRPPLPVRVCLVSATTALATPAFPVLGFLYLTARIALPDAQLRRAMEGRWGGLVSFAAWTLLPNLYGGAAASLLLPFAIGNAVVAGAAYGAADVVVAAVGVGVGGGTSGKNLATRITDAPHLLGSGVGATVGYVAPHHLYGPMLETMYGMEGMSSSIQHIVNLPYVTSTCVVTGAAAGMILHPLLYYPVHGVPGWHWGTLSGAAFTAVLASSFYVYRGWEDARLPLPTGSYVDPSTRDVVDSILRYDVSREEVRTYSLLKGEFVGPPDRCMEGRRIAEACRSYSGGKADWASTKIWGGGSNDDKWGGGSNGKFGWNVWGAARDGSERAVFDDRVLAFVYNYWDAGTRARYPERVVTIKTEAELQRTQDSAAWTDAAAVCITLQNEKGYDANTMKVLTIIEDLNSSKGGQQLISYKVKQFKDVSTAIELLMMMKRSNQAESNDVSVEALERFVRERFPDLTLYSADERYPGMSVESQLRVADWKGSGLSNALDRWKSVQEMETQRIWKNRRFFLVVSGILLSVAGSMLCGTV